MKLLTIFCILFIVFTIGIMGCVGETPAVKPNLSSSEGTVNNKSIQTSSSDGNIPGSLDEQKKMATLIQPYLRMSVECGDSKNKNLTVDEKVVIWQGLREFKSSLPDYSKYNQDLPLSRQAVSTDKKFTIIFVTGSEARHVGYYLGTGSTEAFEEQFDFCVVRYPEGDCGGSFTTVVYPPREVRGQIPDKGDNGMRALVRMIKEAPIRE
jgi:hypothetical protein